MVVRRDWATTYARCRQLGSALQKRGVGLGDTVAAMLPNIPEMFELHFGVPMSGATLNTLNIRLDAETIAFMLEHGEAKILLTDREFSETISKALRLMPAAKRPLVIDVDDPAVHRRPKLGTLDYERCWLKAIPSLPGKIRPVSGRRFPSTTPPARPAIPKGWSTTIAARI
jgi:fatty-acyl-CoA synthase